MNQETMQHEDTPMATMAHDQWNAAVSKHGGSFLQSFEWGTIQEATGHTVFRIERKGLFGQLIAQRLPLGLRSLYVPRGPVGEWRSWPEWFAEMRKLACERGAAFIRLEPPHGLAAEVIGRYGFTDTGRSVQPRQNLVLSLAASEQELLAHMHEKTRYNIRVARRHGVVAGTWNMGRETFEQFFDLLRATAKRQRIALHPKEHYAAILEHADELPMSHDQVPTTKLYWRVYLASFAAQPLAAALVLYFGNRAAYVHGGSSRKYKNVMAPYALHATIMRDAKMHGFTEYDLGGIDEERWPGLTRFKKGFGGRVEEYPNAFDLPVQRLRYGLYRLARKVRR